MIAINIIIIIVIITIIIITCSNSFLFSVKSNVSLIVDWFGSRLMFKAQKGITS